MVFMYHVSDITHDQYRWKKAPERNDPDGKLSVNARRKLKNSIRWLIACSEWKTVFEKKKKRQVKWKINMLTFTFKENMQDDKLARSIFSQWIEMAKYRFGMVHYVWKAEPQKRGAIHFHLSTNVYIPHKELCYTWNRLLFKHGIDQRNSNSTDVHACEQVRDLEAYLSDYFLNEEKHEGRRKIKGKLWGCSHGLSRAGKLYLELGKEYAKECHNDWINDSLEVIIRREGKEPPEFLQYISIWKPEKFPPLPMAIYENELRILKEYEIKQPEFFPREFKV